MSTRKPAAKPGSGLRVPDDVLRAFHSGEELRLGRYLGAHPETRRGVPGVRFAVWAPGAAGVEVVGDFNRWEPGDHPLERHVGHGVWEVFVPRARAGQCYKYLVTTKLGGRQLLKSDPMAFATERRPDTGSVITEPSGYEWRDSVWMAQREQRHEPDRPMATYEVHLGSWRRNPENPEPVPAPAPPPPSVSAAADSAGPDAAADSTAAAKDAGKPRGTVDDDRSAPAPRDEPGGGDGAPGPPAGHHHPGPGVAAELPHGNGEWKTYRQLAEELVPYARQMGYTHLELLPVTEHPFDGSWGYQTTGYFAPTSRFGTPDDLRYFVDEAHRAGLGVILDWVPAHFPRDAHALGFFDGMPIYEDRDPQRRVHPDWDTYIFDYGRPEVVSFLLSSACYWLEEFHLDGIRVDAVASMLYLDYSRKAGEWKPNEKGGRENLEAVAFIRRFNEVIHERFPGVLTIAEESTSWPGVTAPVSEGGLGFDLKWNMGWMNDTLDYFRLDPLARGAHQEKLTFSLMYAFTERYLLPLSHDEVVHGKAALLSKMPGDPPQQFANLRSLYGFMAAHPGKKLLFMGGELGQRREWNHDRELDWGVLDTESHRQLQTYLGDLNRFYAASPELWEVDNSWDGFQWIDFSDRDRSVFAFLRFAAAERRFMVVLANFTPVAWKDYRLGVPEASGYRVAFNGDRPEYGGMGVAVPDPIPVESVERHGRGHSIVLTVPPLSVLFLRPVDPGNDPRAVTKSADDE